MRSRMLPATLMTLALCAPGALSAQTTPYVETSVTFLVPVNLTQLSPDLEKVRLLCNLTSSVLNMSAPWGNGTVPIPMDEVPVTSGQVVTTLRIVIPILDYWLQDPIGKQADYQCGLQGYSKSLQRWDQFTDHATDAVFRLTPTPPILQGSFVW